MLSSIIRYYYIYIYNTMWPSSWVVCWFFFCWTRMFFSIKFALHFFPRWTRKLCAEMQLSWVPKRMQKDRFETPWVKEVFWRIHETMGQSSAKRLHSALAMCVLSGSCDMDNELLLLILVSQIPLAAYLFGAKATPCGRSFGLANALILCNLGELKEVLFHYPPWN